MPRAMKVSKKAAAVKLTDEQVEIGAKYLACSNLCSLEGHGTRLKNVDDLKRAVHRGVDQAIFGGVEGGQSENEAERGVNKEIEHFRKQLKKGDQFYIASLRKELPFFV